MNKRSDCRTIRSSDFSYGHNAKDRDWTIARNMCLFHMTRPIKPLSVSTTWNLISLRFNPSEGNLVKIRLPQKCSALYLQSKDSEQNIFARKSNLNEITWSETHFFSIFYYLWTQESILRHVQWDGNGRNEAANWHGRDFSLSRISEKI